MINSNGFYYQDTLDSEIISINPDGFVWPIPGYTRISSYFGKRVSPTSGASSSHSSNSLPRDAHVLYRHGIPSDLHAEYPRV